MRQSFSLIVSFVSILGSILCFDIPVFQCKCSVKRIIINIPMIIQTFGLDTSSLDVNSHNVFEEQLLGWLGWTWRGQKNCNTIVKNDVFHTYLHVMLRFVRWPPADQFLGYWFQSLCLFQKKLKISMRYDKQRSVFKKQLFVFKPFFCGCWCVFFWNIGENNRATNNQTKKKQKKNTQQNIIRLIGQNQRHIP